MQIKGTTGEYSEIQFSKPELLILKKALEEMSEAISDREFETRVGASRKEVKEVLASIENLINSNIPLAIFKCLYKEVTLFNNALNEVLYGLGISNFELKVGKNEEAKILLKDVHKLMREMSLVRRKDEELNLFSKSDFSRTGQHFSLQADGYRVTFNLKHFLYKKEKVVGVFTVLALDTGPLEFSITSSPKPMSVETLKNFVESLERYITETNSDSILNNFKFHNEIFQVEVSSVNTISDNEKLFSLYFSINLSYVKYRAANPGFGAKAAITYQNLYSFTSSIQKFLEQAPTKE